jgi:hypothetical protein
VAVNDSEVLDEVAGRVDGKEVVGFAPQGEVIWFEVRSWPVEEREERPDPQQELLL